MHGNNTSAFVGTWNRVLDRVFNVNNEETSNSATSSAIAGIALQVRCHWSDQDRRNAAAVTEATKIGGTQPVIVIVLRRINGERNACNAQDNEEPVQFSRTKNTQQERGAACRTAKATNDLKTQLPFSAIRTEIYISDQFLLLKIECKFYYMGFVYKFIFVNLIVELNLKLACGFTRLKWVEMSMPQFPLYNTSNNFNRRRIDVYILHKYLWKLRCLFNRKWCFFQ